VSAVLPSLANLEPNPHWPKLSLFHRKGWRKLPFGEFTENVNEHVDPADAAKEIYVGLDDLDSGSLHIRRCGKGRDPSQSLTFSHFERPLPGSVRIRSQLRSDFQFQFEFQAIEVKSLRRMRDGGAAEPFTGVNSSE
jgi:hypothetical protein